MTIFHLRFTATLSPFGDQRYRRRQDDGSSIVFYTFSSGALAGPRSEDGREASGISGFMAFLHAQKLFNWRNLSYRWSISSAGLRRARAERCPASAARRLAAAVS